MSLTCTTCSAPLRTGAPGHGHYDGVPACSKDHGQQAVDAIRAHPVYHQVAVKLGANHTKYHVQLAHAIMMIGGKRDAEDAELDAGGTPKNAAMEDAAASAASSSSSSSPPRTYTEKLPTDALWVIAAFSGPFSKEMLTNLLALDSRMDTLLKSSSTYKLWRESNPADKYWRRAVSVVGRMRLWGVLDAMLAGGVLPNTLERDCNVAFYARPGAADVLAELGRDEAVSDDTGKIIVPQNGRIVAKQLDGVFLIPTTTVAAMINVMHLFADIELAWNLGTYLSTLRYKSSRLHLPGNLNVYANLRAIEVRSARVNYTHGDFENLASLEQLSLYECKIDTFPRDIFTCTKLRKLILYGTRLENVPPGITALTDLELLNLAGTDISSMPVGIGALPRLTTLKVSSGNITVIPDGELSPSLQALYVFAQNLQVIDLEKCKSLKKLYVAVGEYRTNVYVLNVSPNVQIIGYDGMPRITFADTTPGEATENLVRKKGQMKSYGAMWRFAEDKIVDQY